MAGKRNADREKNSRRVGNPQREDQEKEKIMSKGKLIVIEGTDGSGKRTQSELLYKHLTKLHIKSAMMHVPVYESFTGELIARYLRNEFGRLNPYLAATLFAVNRFQFRDKIVNWLKEGRVVVLNRYVTANQIHQSAHLHGKEKAEFIKWIGKMEYEIFAMPKPDLTLFLNVPVLIASGMIKRKPAKERKYAFGGKEDILESDLMHQQEALKQALRMAGTDKNSRQINAAGKTALLPKAEIAAMIWSEVSKFLKIK